MTLNAALSAHPALVSLDLGDCMLGDEALRLVCGMLPPDGAKSGGCNPQCTWLWRSVEEEGSCSSIILAHVVAHDLSTLA